MFLLYKGLSSGSSTFVLLLLNVIGKVAQGLVRVILAIIHLYTVLGIRLLLYVELVGQYFEALSQRCRKSMRYIKRDKGIKIDQTISVCFCRRVVICIIEDW